MKINRKVIMTILAIMGSATFGQFIIEESLQNVGFGVGVAVMAKAYESNPKQAMEQIDRYQQFHNSATTIMTLLYFANPITAIWFHQYIVSDQMKIDDLRNIAKAHAQRKQQTRDFQVSDIVMVKVQLTKKVNNYWYCDLEIDSKDELNESHAIVREKDIVSKLK